MAQFQAPGDIPGQVVNPLLPSPPPFDNVYSFTVFLKSQLPPPLGTSLGGAYNHLGNQVSVVAPSMQAAFQAVVAQYGSDLANLRGPCATFVGASHQMSQAAGASMPVGISGSSKSPQSESSTHHDTTKGSRLR